MEDNNFHPTDANPLLPGFTKPNLNNHFGSGLPSDHSNQYPNFSKEQYAQKALELVRSPVSNTIKGYKATRGLFIGSIVRYDTSTNDWVRGTSYGITTMFKPDEKSAYFKRISKLETMEVEDAKF